MARRAEVENVVRFTKPLLASLAVQSGKKERVVWDQEVPGFGIRLRATGGRTWVIRPPRSGGSSKLHALGSADLIELPAARKEAREKLAQAALGGDPTKERREARAQAAITLGSLIETYVGDKIAKGRRSSTIYGIRNHLNLHWQELHDRPLSAITRAEVAAIHRKLALTHPHAADRARSILTTFFAWAIGEGLTEMNPVLNTNTATTPTRRDRVLSDVELAAVWHGCADDDHGRIVRLLVLTGQRRNEVAGMRWSEIDLQGAAWTIPAERMKNKRPHLVPLSRAAMEILSAIPEREGRDLVFGQGRGGFSGFTRAKDALDKRLGDSVGAWGLHDLRRTASTGMHGLGIPPHIVEITLSHTSIARAGVAGNYNWHAYADEKRDALDRWADHVARIVRRPAAG